MESLIHNILISRNSRLAKASLFFSTELTVIMWYNFFIVTVERFIEVDMKCKIFNNMRETYVIGLARGTVKIIPYNFEWQDVYRQEEKLLCNLLGESAIDIQHVGSTSIEGLDSKPIIDIAIGVKSLDNVDKFRNSLEGAGYEFRGKAGIEGRIMFAKGIEELRTHYLHIEIFNGELRKNHIYFRDYLRLNKKSVEEYSRVKKELSL